MIEVAQASHSSPQLRFPEFKGRWDKETIGGVSKIFGRIGYRGYTVQDIVSKGEGAISLSPSNFINNQIDITKSIYISWFKYEESPEIKILDGDILFVKTGSTYGKTAFVSNIKEKATINPQIVVLKNISISNKFLGYIVATQTIKKQVEQIVVGGAIPTMSQKELSKMEFGLPAKPEQQKIAAFLTSVDNKIEQLSKKQELLGEYKKGLMQKIFSQEIRFKTDDGGDFPDWEEKKLGDITDLITKGTTPTSVGYNFTTEGINFIKVESIKNLKIDIGSVPKISEECHHHLKRSQLKNNDIVFSIAGTLGRTAIVKNKDLPANTNQALSIIRLNRSQHILFVHYLLNLESIDKYIHRMLSVGAQPNLSLQQVGDIQLQLPSLLEQTKIANFLISVDNKIEQVGKQLDESKQFKKALLQQMFV